MSTTHTVTDSTGREITFRELDVFDYSEFLLALGSSASANEEYKRFAQFAYSLVSIDGQLKLTPKNLDQIKANIRHLDTAGYNAIMAYFLAQNADAENETESSRETTVATLKNS